MFKSTIVTLLTLTMAFSTLAAPLPVPVTGIIAEEKRATGTIEVREPGMTHYGGP
ncbi:hypothetical protein EG327_006972 [Venturia inaequalis]|uniref:Uncharacterized protein n=1 Tax=Venturia inaequalis TaxID=5025 RepID=A0A8H3VU85_VENIN|nr:hypothetical protein EG327_006972 [Venturia inaequalis]